MKIDLISQRRENVLFLPSNMAAMTSHENALYRRLARKVVSAPCLPAANNFCLLVSLNELSDLLEIPVEAQLKQIDSVLGLYAIITRAGSVSISGCLCRADRPRAKYPSRLIRI